MTSQHEPLFPMNEDAKVVFSVSVQQGNADLIADMFDLGYLKEDDLILDPTYGKGNFWKKRRPAGLMASDINPDRSPLEPADFRNTPWPDNSFDAVVFDPPYKLNGTSTGAGASGADSSYGVDGDWGAIPWQERHEIIKSGVTEAARVLQRKGHLLLKCQDQVCSGQVRWQTWIFAEHAATLGLRLKDRFDILSYRAQPLGRSQKHARRVTSSLLVFVLEK